MLTLPSLVRTTSVQCTTLLWYSWHTSSSIYAEIYDLKTRLKLSSIWVGLMLKLLCNLHSKTSELKPFLICKECIWMACTCSWRKACGFLKIKLKKKNASIFIDTAEYLLKVQWQSGFSEDTLTGFATSFHVDTLLLELHTFFPSKETKNFVYLSLSFVLHKTECRSSKNISCFCLSLKGTITWLHFWKVICVDFSTLNVRYNNFNSFHPLPMWRLCL